MPLYQPSNITPSTFAGIGGGTIAADDFVKVTWQVNGNVPMTAFKIDFYENDSSSTFVHSTGIISSGFGLPFYGIDENGNPVFFVYESTDSYSEIGIENGKEYKLKITQYWNNQTTADYTVAQYSDSVFISREVPSVGIDSFGASVTTVAKTFTATYEQEQGDALNDVRWTLFDNTANEMVGDTGIIRTPILTYTYRGFINTHNYTLSVVVETENGVMASDSKSFDCEYAQIPSSNELTLECAKNGGVKLTFGSAVDIPGEASSPTGYSADGGVLSLNAGETITWDEVNGSAMNFSAPYAISWRGEAKEPYTETYRVVGSDIKMAKTYYFSPDGTKVAFLSNNGTPSVLIYSVSDSSFTEIGYIPRETETEVAPFAGAWTKDGERFIVCGGQGFGVTSSTKRAYIRSFLVTSSSVTSETYIARGTKYGAYSAIAFSDDGAKMYVANQNKKGYITTEIYDYDGSEFSISSESFDDSVNGFEGSTCDGILYASNKLICYGVFGGSTSGRIWITVSDVSATISLRSSFESDSSMAYLRGDCSEDGKIFVLRCRHITNLEYGTHVFDMENEINQIQYIPSLVYGVKSVFLSYDGSILLDGNDFYGRNGNKYLLYGRPLTSRELVMQKNAEIVLEVFNGAVSIYKRNDSQIMSFGDFSISQIGIQALLEYGATEAYVTICKDAASTIFVYETNGENATFHCISVDEEETEIRGRSTSAFGITDQPITDVVLYGEQKCEFVHIGTESVFDETFTPRWNANTVFFANFYGDLQAGTISNSGAVSTAIYRSEDGRLIPLTRVPSDTTEFIDFGVKSGKTVGYTTYYVDNNVYSSATESAETIYMQTLAYYLYECTADDENANVFHVKKVFAFSNNVDGGSVSNNNNPNWLENFTKYPVRQPSTQMAKSGTLSAMLSNVKNGKYADSAEQMDAVYSISESTNTFFLKDRKGNLYMVGVDGAVTQQINDASAVQEVSVSIPWREIGDANGKVVIQLPTDEGWNADAENAVRDNGTIIGEQIVTITENGVTVVKPRSGIAAMSKITIITEVNDVDIEKIVEEVLKRIPIDGGLSLESENAVQNKVVTEALNGKYELPAAGIPASDMTEDVQASLARADTALQTAPVTSVNGMTGDVVVPTGGEKTWEAITTIEMAEAGVLRIDADKYGNPLSLDQVWVHFQTSADTAPTTTVCWGKGAFSSYHMISQIATGTIAGNKKGIAAVVNVNGFHVPISRGFTAGNNSNFQSYGNSAIPSFMLETEPITHISTSTSLPAGTKVIVYGIRSENQ